MNTSVLYHINRLKFIKDIVDNKIRVLALVIDLLEGMYKVFE